MHSKMYQMTENRSFHVHLKPYAFSASLDCL